MEDSLSNRAENGEGRKMLDTQGRAPEARAQGSRWRTRPATCKAAPKTQPAVQAATVTAITPEAVEEAMQLLQSLRLARVHLKAATRLVDLKDARVTGLIDGGATACLRTTTEQERIPKSVRS